MRWEIAPATPLTEQRRGRGVLATDSTRSRRGQSDHSARRHRLPQLHLQPSNDAAEVCALRLGTVAAAVHRRDADAAHLGGLHPVREHPEHLDPPLDHQQRVHLHDHGGGCRLLCGHLQRQRGRGEDLDGEAGGQVFGAAAVDESCGDVNGADLPAGLGDAERAVKMRERRAFGVLGNGTPERSRAISVVFLDSWGQGDEQGNMSTLGRRRPSHMSSVRSY